MAVASLMPRPRAWGRWALWACANEFIFGGRVLIESEGGAGTSITVALPLAAIAPTLA